MSAPSNLFRSQSNAVSPSAVRRLRGAFLAGRTPPAPGSSSSSAAVAKSLTTLQDANPRNLPELWFSPTFPLANAISSLGSDPRNNPEDRKVKLGKTLRILQERLPTLLQSPLPQDILSPNISLHLFPSTHPHLPTVSGRVAYMAALWTSPIAWNRVPVVGNVRLEILSERMVDHSVHPSPQRPGACGELLIVRWRTVGKTKGSGWGLSGKENGVGEQIQPRAPVGTAEAVGSGKEFTGLFIFEFDEEGRILSHTIEHVQEGGQWERGVGAKVVGLTDWLLGGIRGGSTPFPAYARKQR